MCHKLFDNAWRLVIKVVPKGMRHCLENYLDENKVVSVSDGQNYIVVGEGERKNSYCFIF